MIVTDFHFPANLFVDLFCRALFADIKATVITFDVNQGVIIYDIKILNILFNAFCLFPRLFQVFKIEIILQNKVQSLSIFCIEEIRRVGRTAPILRILIQIFVLQISRNIA